MIPAIQDFENMVYYPFSERVGRVVSAFIYEKLSFSPVVFKRLKLCRTLTAEDHSSVNIVVVVKKPLTVQSAFVKKARKIKHGLKNGFLSVPEDRFHIVCKKYGLCAHSVVVYHKTRAVGVRFMHHKGKSYSAVRRKCPE